MQNIRRELRLPPVDADVQHRHGLASGVLHRGEGGGRRSQFDAVARRGSISLPRGESGALATYKNRCRISFDARTIKECQ